MKKQSIDLLETLEKIEMLEVTQQNQLLGGKSKAADKQDYIIIEENPII